MEEGKGWIYLQFALLLLAGFFASQLCAASDPIFHEKFEESFDGRSWTVSEKEEYSGLKRLQVNYDSVSFRLEGATWQTYRDFVGELRALVTRGSTTVQGLPVLRPASQVPVGNQQRFVLVNLFNRAGNNVNLAVDVTNLYVVAFSSSDGKSYFFSDTYEQFRTYLFPGTTKHSLLYRGNYIDLENRAGNNRDQIPLGPTPLDVALTNMWHGGQNTNIFARPLLVVIQMVSEAARFGYIEERVRQSITSGNTFTPSGLIVSMENEWSTISLAVQTAGPNGVFTTVVTLQEDGTYRNIEVRDFNTLSRYTMVKILLTRTTIAIATATGNPNQQYSLQTVLLVQPS